MPYNTPAPSTLGDIYGMDPGAFFQAQQLIGGGMQQNEQDLQQSRLANLFTEKNNPQLLEAQGLQNQMNRVRLPGMEAESDILGMNRDKQKTLYDDTIKAARTKFMSEASDAHLKELEDKAQEMAYSKDLVERQRGEQILMMSKEMIRERSKQADMSRRQLELERERGRINMDRDKQAIDAGKYAKSGRGGNSIQEQIASGKLSYEKAATMLAGAAFMADEEGNTELADKYRAMADDYNAKFIAGKRAGAQATAETKPALSAFDIQTNPNVPAEAFKPVGRVDPAQRIRQDLSQGAQFSSPEVEAKVRAKAGVSDKPAMPKNEADYNALPSGTLYQAPDGSIKRKK